MTFKKNKKGFSLIEMLLVIGVLSVLLIAAFVVYPRVQESSKVSQEVKNIAMIKAGVANYFEQQGSNYTSLGEASTKEGNLFANRARLIPESMNGGDYNTSALRHSFGGEVWISATTNAHEGYAAGRTLVIRYTDVPSSACIKLVTEASGLFVKINVEEANTVLSKGNLSLDKMVSACNSKELVRLVFIGQ